MYVVATVQKHADNNNNNNNIHIANFSYGYDQMRITNKYSFQQLRVFDSLQQRLTYILTVNALR